MKLDLVIKSWLQGVNQIARPKYRYQENDDIKIWFKKTLSEHKNDIEELWHCFNDERHLLKKNLLSNPRYLHAYTLVFHLFNFAKASIALNRLEKRHAIKKIIEKYNQINIYDFGCGSGAMSQAVAHFIEDCKPLVEKNIHLIDQSKNILDIAGTIIHQQLPNAILKPIRCAVEDYRYDLPPNTNCIQILNFGYIWNELNKNQQAKQNILKIIDTTTKSSIPSLILLVDSAHEAQTKKLIKLRDELVSSGLDCLYPCPTGQTLCPMTARVKDRCFTSGPTILPKFYEFVDNVLGTKHHTLSSSSYIFINNALAKMLKLKNHSVIVGMPTNKQASKPKSISKDLLICKTDFIDRIKGNSKKTYYRGDIYE